MNPVDELNLLLGIGPSRPQLPLTLRKSGYVPVRSLGKGSYGQALLVFHEPQQQYFVVKHLHLAGMSSRQRHDAHNEIHILQKLHHPNIVRYVEYYEEHPHLYIVMEYADGGDVYSLLSGAQSVRRPGAAASGGGGGGGGVYRADAAAGLLSEAQVVSLFVQTTMAVKYMHDRRLLHRDIKSSNIFLTKNHVVKLGDFGISTVLQSTVAMASTMCGTPCYFSPELCQGRPYNSKSDVWALGVLLYELCAGHVPFESTTMKALMRDIVHKQPPRIPTLYSDALWELIVLLLHKDPRRRPDAGQVLLSPVLMKHVPDLIHQLADNDGGGDRGDAAARLTPATAGGGEASGGPLPPPPPPRRGQPQPQPLPSEQTPAPPFGAAGNAGGGISLGPTSTPRAQQPPPPQQQQQQQPQQQRAPRQQASNAGDGNSGAPSIEELLARFDKQKMRIAEAKQRKSGSQADPPAPSSNSSGGGGGGGGGGADAVPRLSPGAAAALRQQGVRVDDRGSDVPARPSAFVPPPLPAALRDRGGAEQRRPPVLPSSPPTQQRDDGAAAVGARAAAAAAAVVAAPAGGVHAAAAVGAGVAAAPAGELRAVLSELSSWRERSVRRQQRHDDTGKGSRSGGAPAAPDAADAPALSPQPPSSPSTSAAAPPRQQRTAAEPAAASSPNGGAVRRGSGKDSRTAAQGGASSSPSHSHAHVSGAAGAAGEGEEEDEDGERSNALSFVDALGTALDVDAIQAASAAAHQHAPQPQQPTAAPPPPLMSSGRVAAPQQSMRRTYQGTSDKLNTMQATLSSGILFRHVPATAMQAGTMRGAAALPASGGDASGDGGAADMHFTTSCICGRASTSLGCLSMIYGSFVCSCDVCVRFTGAAHGVEWLHLPEEPRGLSALLPTATAGTGAAAAAALRAQLGSAAETPPIGCSGAGVGGQSGEQSAGAPPSRAPSAASSDALAYANIRVYVHRPPTHPSSPPAEKAPPDAAGCAHYVMYTCVTCGALMGMLHDGVEGLLLPKATLDRTSLEILSSCAQTVDMDAAEMMGID
ncbi:protein kinase [Novymonas esmeraldas]|uniref:non-specific serine/threonine protein kinase n=1 Tax=Novymonas esmeraldas TaxID=1808958 RepID=A0AAW0EXP6_9TRYP